MELKCTQIYPQSVFHICTGGRKYFRFIYVPVKLLCSTGKGQAAITPWLLVAITRWLVTISPFQVLWLTFMSSLILSMLELSFVNCFLRLILADIPIKAKQADRVSPSSRWCPSCGGQMCEDSGLIHEIITHSPTHHNITAYINAEDPLVPLSRALGMSSGWQETSDWTAEGRPWVKGQTNILYVLRTWVCCNSLHLLVCTYWLLLTIDYWTCFHITLMTTNDSHSSLHPLCVLPTFIWF